MHPVQVAEAATDHARLLRLRDQASAGALTLRLADVLPADEAAQAHHRLAEGGVRNRLVPDFTAFQRRWTSENSAVSGCGFSVQPTS